VTKRRASVRRQLDGESEGHILFDKPPVMADNANNQAAGKMTAEQMMTFMDSNGDGKITRDEAPADIKAGFDFVDQNKDGGIDINEAQIMADYANNQAAEQAEVQSSTANEEKLQSPTTKENVKYESAAVVDQVGTETIEVLVGNMYFSMEMSGSHQLMITDLKQYLQVEEAVNENMLPSGTQYVAAQVLGLAGYEMKSGWNQPTANGQGSHTIVAFQRKIN
jgi:Ca2+-binding EF-hand superfamily protein